AVAVVGREGAQEAGEWVWGGGLDGVPRRAEGLPNVLRESLACGTPFVASRVGGIPEIADGVVNRLVPPGDATALADALSQSLAARVPTEVVRSHSTGWTESARSLLQPLLSLAATAQAVDRPWWSGRKPPPVRPESRLSHWHWRQVLRRQLAAAMPRRWFLVRGPAQSSSVCLTFDDGPHPDYTPRLLEV